MKTIALKRSIARLIPEAVWLRYKKRQRRVCFISYPKCGRTWLRIMVGKALAEQFQLDDINPVNLHELHRYSDQIPRITVCHDDKPHRKRPENIETDKRKYASSRIIFLVRDPRDVVVSYYFQMAYRNKEFVGTISDFIRQDVGGIQSLITFYNVWGAHQHEPAGLLLVTYEDLHIQPEIELQRIFDFMAIKIETANLNTAVAFGRFQNMRQLEKSHALVGRAMQTDNLADINAYKTRKGEVGGYRETLDQADIEYLNRYINTNLSDFYSYKTADN